MLQTKEAKTMNRWKRSTVLVLVLLLILVAVASAAASDEDPMQKIGAILLDVKDPVRQAAGFAAVGLNSYSDGDCRMYAQAAVNLLEGEDSELYDETILGDLGGMLGFFQAYPKGIRGRVEELTLLPAEWEALDESATADEVQDGWASFEAIFRVASAELQDVLWPSSCSGKASDHFLIAYSLLQNAQDMVSTMLEWWGLELYVSPGESIQAAIDAARAGAIIHIAPGVYRESLEITKSLTIDGIGWADLWVGPDFDLDDWDAHSTVVQPTAQQMGIRIASDEPIEVVLSTLVVDQASTGFAVEGQATVSIQQCGIADCEIGLLVSGTGDAFLEDCWFGGNGSGVKALDDAAVTLDDCSVLDSMCVDQSAIDIRGNAVVTITDVRIRDGAGSGIVVADAGTLTVVDGFIRGNGGDGMLLAGQATLRMTGTEFYANGGFGLRALSEECALPADQTLEMFSGTIRGSDNYFASPENDYVGNKLGRFCPNDLDFLLKDATD